MEPRMDAARVLTSKVTSVSAKVESSEPR
jgi:hypothetical protein